MSEDRNRFELVGTLEDAAEVPYGSEGKSLANITVRTTTTNWRDELEDVDVVLSVFGKDRDKCLNVGLGRRVQVLGHLTCVPGKTGGMFLRAAVDKVTFAAQAGVDKTARRDTPARRPPETSTRRLAPRAPDCEDDIPF